MEGKAEQKEPAKTEEGREWEDGAPGKPTKIGMAPTIKM